MLKQVSLWIDHLNVFIGKGVSWVTSLLVLLICSDVFLRYVFNTTKTWVIELEWHLFGLIIFLGAAYALQKDRHVRVDLFYANFSRKTKNWIDFIGTLIFLIPWCTVIIYTAWDYAMNSFSFHEASPNPGGLPARYVIKFVICFGFVLLLLQAISMLIKIILSRFNHQIKEGQP